MYHKLRMTRIALVLILAGLGITIIALFSYAHRQDEAMTVLVNGYDTCMADSKRTTVCELEYDGDGSTNTPEDWHWYWR